MQTNVGCISAMKLLVYGDASPGSGAWCYVETLREMGHDVSQIGDSAGLGHYRTSLKARVYRRTFKRLQEGDRRHHVGLLMNQVERLRPEIIIVLKGLYLSDNDVRQLRRNNAWICNINHDDFFSSNPNNWSRLQRAAVPAYDWIFTTREVNLKEVQPLNANVSFLQFAYYPKIHRIVPIPHAERERWDVDAVFAGTFAVERARLLETLVSQVPARYAVYGSQWEKLSPRSPLRKWVCHQELHFDDMAKALGGAKVSLGFLRKENRDDYTQRTFEIPACGGCFLAERTARHGQIYQEGEEAEFFAADAPDELCEQFRRLLQGHERRESIRQRGHAALLRQRHTYRDRMEQLLATYKSSSVQATG